MQAVDDPGNVLDTPDTIREIEVHNARWRAVCEEEEE